MNLQSYLVLAVVFLAAAGAVWYLYRQRKKKTGCCNGHCEACGGASCRKK